MIEATVLTGFLGSGKTTLLSRLLRQPEFSRTAVIINEFGDIGLDHELVEASEDSIIALQTGCLCCKIRSDLATTIHDLLRRRDEGSVTAFDRVVIETSGLADPAPILQTLMTDPTIAEPYRAWRRRHHRRCGERRTHPRPRGDFGQAGRRRRSPGAHQNGPHRPKRARIAATTGGAQRDGAASAGSPWRGRRAAPVRRPALRSSHQISRCPGLAWSALTRQRTRTPPRRRYLR